MVGMVQGFGEEEGATQADIGLAQTSTRSAWRTVAGGFFPLDAGHRHAVGIGQPLCLFG